MPNKEFTHFFMVSWRFIGLGFVLQDFVGIYRAPFKCNGFLVQKELLRCVEFYLVKQKSGEVILAIGH